MHGLYSNVVGCLVCAPINYALLVACMCDRHKDVQLLTLLTAFSRSFSNSTADPAHGLRSFSNQKELAIPCDTHARRTTASTRRFATSGFGHKDESARLYAVLAVLTPTYQSMNSADNVGKPQLFCWRLLFKMDCRSCSRTLKRAKSSGQTCFRTSSSGIPYSPNQYHGVQRG